MAKKTQSDESMVANPAMLDAMGVDVDSLPQSDEPVVIPDDHPLATEQLEKIGLEVRATYLIALYSSQSLQPSHIYRPFTAERILKFIYTEAGIEVTRAAAQFIEQQSRRQHHAVSIAMRALEATARIDAEKAKAAERVAAEAE